jgi:hypothetical protein
VARNDAKEQGQSQNSKHRFLLSVETNNEATYLIVDLGETNTILNSPNRKRFHNVASLEETQLYPERGFWSRSVS